MSDNIDELLEEIDDLKDQIHNLTIDLASLREKNRSYEEKICDIIDDRDQLKDEISDLQDTISKLETENKNEEERIKGVEEKYKIGIHEVQKKKKNYERVLCMWETVRQGNFDYFNTDQGESFLRWADCEFHSLWR